MDFDSFQRDWLGRRVDYDKTFAYQCVDLILEYLHECYQVNSAHGNAIDFWTSTDPGLLVRFYKDATSEASKGDIVVFNGKPGNPYGHIGIATGNINEADIEILEQNGATGNGSGIGGDAIRTRYVSRSRVAGILRPRPVPPFNPDEHKTLYATPRHIILNKSVNKWNITYPDFNGIATHPVDHKDQGYQFTVVAYMNHPCGETYLLESMSDVGGWNSKDCDDYVPTPYVPPAPPRKAVLAETYQLVTTVIYYDTYEDAFRDQNAKGTKAEGTYFVRGKRGNLYELADTNMSNSTVWINTDKNVPPAPTPPKIVETVKAAAELIPEPQPEQTPYVPTQPSWMQTRAFFNTDGSPEYFCSTNTADMTITDLSSKQGAPMTLHAFTKHIPIIATYEIDGTLYGLPEKSYDVARLYLIPMRVLKYETPTIVERVESVINNLQLSDRFNEAKYRLTKFIDGIKQTKANKD